MNTNPVIRRLSSAFAHWARSRRRAQGGFSLVEIAVVLIIVGLALGTGIAIFQARVEQAQIDTTRTRAEAIRQALVAHVARTYRLPCPAAPGLVSGAAGYNVEQGGGTAACTTGSGLVNNVGGAPPLGVSRGTVPCTTLGLTEETCLDAWGSRFTYFVSNAATTLTVLTVSGMQGTMTVHRVTPTSAATPLHGLAPTGNQLNACSTTAGDNSCNLAAVAVIISHGANQGGGFPPGSAVAMATGQASIYETPNFNNDIRFFQNEYVKDKTNAFDDILVAIPARDIISTLSQNNTLKDPRVLMNEQFETIKLALIQHAYSTISGTSPNKTITLANESGAPVAYAYPGTPTFDVTGCTPLPVNNSLGLPTATVAALTGLNQDIWGTPIRYKKLTAGPFPSSNPCFTPFVLISYGPDRVTGGATGTADDILFPVTQGQINAAVIKLGGW